MYSVLGSKAGSGHHYRSLAVCGAIHKCTTVHGIRGVEGNQNKIYDKKGSISGSITNSHTFIENISIPKLFVAKYPHTHFLSQTSLYIFFVIHINHLYTLCIIREKLNKVYIMVHKAKEEHVTFGDNISHEIWRTTQNEINIFLKHYLKII